MRTPLLVIAAIAAGLTSGCSGEGSASGAPTTTRSVPGATSTVPPPTVTPTTVVPTTTTRPPPATVRAAITTTTHPLTRADATSRLCAAVKEGDAAVQSGSFVKGGLRLGGGIAANEKAADQDVLAAARAMLNAGVNGDVERYATARRTASAACARAGYPIQLGGPIQCVTTPCP